MLGILFATTMVFAAGTYVMPSAVTTGRKHEYPILELDGKILQSIQVLFILLLIILLIWTIVLIKKNINAGKNKNQIIIYGIKKFLWIGIVAMFFLFIPQQMKGSSYIGMPDESMGELFFHCILKIIPILMLIPQIFTIKNLRNNLKGMEIKAIQKTEDTAPIPLMPFTILVYVYIFIMGSKSIVLLYYDLFVN